MKTLKNLLRKVSQFNNNEFRKEFSRNIEYHLYVIASQRSADYVYNNMQQAIGYDTKKDVHDRAIAELKKVYTNEQLCMEFGVYTGSTINYFARQLPSAIFHGFDSFEGLPEFWRQGFDQGQFKVDLNKLHFEKNITLHPGWFDATLPKFKSEAGQIAFLHVDCDLYSSTKIIFDNLKGKIKPGTLILFDEYFNYPFWENHEYKAFQELVQSENLKYEYLAYSKHDEQVLVKIC